MMEPIATPPAPSAPLLREATEAEDDLIQRLSVAVGHRLLRDWEDLPDELKALPMNRAFLAALGLSLGKLLGAVAINDRDNLEGWNILVEQTLEIVRQTAVEARQALDGMKQLAELAGGLPDASTLGPPTRGERALLEPKPARLSRRAFVPEPKLIM